MSIQPYRPAADPNALDSGTDSLGIDARAASVLPGVQLVDVRRSGVFAAAQDLADGAMWRDPAQVQAWGPSLDPSRPVVVYCVHGHEVSQTAALALSAAGLDARFVRGGYEAWKAAGLSIVPSGT